MQHGPILSPYLEFDITTDAVGTNGPFNAQNHIIRGIAHSELGLEDAPFLLN